MWISACKYQSSQPLLPLLFFHQRESWEQTGSEAVAQVDGLSSEGLPPETISTSLPSTESGNSSQCPSPPRGATMPSQPYPLYPLDEAHYPGLYQPPSSFPCAPYMTASSDLGAKMPPLSTEESENAPPALSDNSPWVKNDVNSAWSPYELRRTYWHNRSRTCRLPGQARLPTNQPTIHFFNAAVIAWRCLGEFFNTV